jgi:uncharacterized membrane protein HdeD (DUF308 family)
MAVQARAAISETRTWFIILGVLLIILGVAAIAFPLLTTIAVTIALGWSKSPMLSPPNNGASSFWTF